jgi:hypothetical protein
MDLVDLHDRGIRMVERRGRLHILRVESARQPEI